MSTQHHFLNEICDAIAANIKAVNVTGLKTVQQGRLALFRAPQRLANMLDALLLIPITTESGIGNQIPGTSGILTIRALYARAWSGGTYTDKDTVDRTQQMVEAVDADPTLNAVNGPATAAGLQVLKCWVTRIDWEPEEDRMFAGKLDAQIDMTAFNIEIDYKARL